MTGGNNWDAWWQHALGRIGSKLTQKGRNHKSGDQVHYANVGGAEDAHTGRKVACQ